MSNVKNNFSSETIIKVGILIDESYFTERENLINELVQHGIGKESIDILIFKDKIKKNETFGYPIFTLKDINWDRSISKDEVRRFTNGDFDLLISYYDIEKAALMLVTQKTKASFKAGFSAIDKRLNHFTIGTVAENYKVFTAELFKYLKILNKI